MEKRRILGQEKKKLGVSTGGGGGVLEFYTQLTSLNTRGGGFKTL